MSFHRIYLIIYFIFFHFHLWGGICYYSKNCVATYFFAVEINLVGTRIGIPTVLQKMNKA